MGCQTSRCKMSDSLKYDMFAMVIKKQKELEEDCYDLARQAREAEDEIAKTALEINRCLREKIQIG